jgi:hypothetical protein
VWAVSFPLLRIENHECRGRSSAEGIWESRPTPRLQEDTNTGGRRGYKARRQVSADPGRQPGERNNDVAVLESSDFTSLQGASITLIGPPLATCKECMVVTSEALERCDSDSVVWPQPSVSPGHLAHQNRKVWQGGGSHVEPIPNPSSS